MASSSSSVNRRNTRLRREYLYRKSLEGKERAEYEKKLKIKEAIREGKPVPTELRHETAALQNRIALDDPEATDLKTHIDDEYANAGVVDPKILLTTSRDPSVRLIQFVKEFRLCVPNSQRINRGNTQIRELVAAARGHDCTDVVIVHEHRGQPDGMIVSHLPYGPTAYFGLVNVVLRHDITRAKAGPAGTGTGADLNAGADLKNVSEEYPHLIFDAFDTALGQRLRNILRFIFPVPKPDSKRVMTFANRNDFISFRHHTFQKSANKKDVAITEVGPRFEMRLYQIKLGTVDQPEADNEWVLRPFMNSAKKRKLL